MGVSCRTITTTQTAGACAEILPCRDRDGRRRRRRLRKHAGAAILTLAAVAGRAEVAPSTPWMACARVRAGCPDRGKSSRSPTLRYKSSTGDPAFAFSSSKRSKADTLLASEAASPRPGITPRLGQPSLADSPPRAIHGPLSAIPGRDDALMSARPRSSELGQERPQPAATADHAFSALADLCPSSKEENF